MPNGTQMDIYEMPLRRFTSKHEVDSSTFVRLLSSFLIVGTLSVCVEKESFAEEIINAPRGITLPTDPFSFHPGHGQEMANTYCIICHSADYIYMQPEHSQKKWQAIIAKMKQVFGCPIPQDQIAPLSTYLFQQNSVSPPSPTEHQ